VLDLAASLNADAQAGLLDTTTLKSVLRRQGAGFLSDKQGERSHMFSEVVFFISSAQMEQMRAVIDAVERVTALAAWRNEKTHLPVRAKGVFFGYDFHLNADGVHLIEINSNAGGAFLNALLVQSQREVALPGVATAADTLEQEFIDMFRHEWRLERGDAPLQTIAIIDELPQQQHLYPDFLLAQRMFERAGIAALIADPAELEMRVDGLYCSGRKIDLVYNRLTDFFLQQHVILNPAHQNANLAVITPHPQAYALYADKYNLTQLSNIDCLRMMAVDEADIAVLQAGVPQTRIVQAGGQEQWWQQRKQWFFKPASGFGSKGAYRGANVTKRVFAEIMQGGYVAQRMAVPSERAVCGENSEPVMLKSDVRCYVYDGKVQLVAARLYQGQTTNFRILCGGFTLVRIVP